MIPIECQSSSGAGCFSDELPNDVLAGSPQKNRHSTIPEACSNVGRLEVLIGYDWYHTSLRMTEGNSLDALVFQHYCE